LTRPSPTPQPNDPVPAGPYTRHLARKFGTSDGQNTLGAKHPGATYTTPLPLLCVHMIWAAERRPWRAARVSHSSTQAAAFLLRREGTRVGVQHRLCRLELQFGAKPPSPKVWSGGECGAWAVRTAGHQGRQDMRDEPRAGHQGPDSSCPLSQLLGLNQVIPERPPTNGRHDNDKPAGRCLHSLPPHSLKR